MRKTEIYNSLILNEYSDGLLFGTDALLLSAFTKGSSKRIGCDLGSGSGVIAMLMLSSNYAKNIYAVEVQEKYAELIKLNLKENSLDNRCVVINSNVSDIKQHIASGMCDFVVTNPPYMQMNCGKTNENESKYIARHEVVGNIDDFCQAAAWCLRSGGNFYVVYRPERMSALLFSMQKHKITPKRLLPVQPSIDERPSLILVEGKKDSADGLIFYKPLYIYTDKKHIVYTNEMQKALSSLIL
ncbi:MAG: hypothetical protein A2Y17_08635 [Clostridiales bacterium GWF2_38_85]|nr:MAG: hypothetical protein A2Y17_08635 [Clostridiales bacterium GWF2_38_85]